MCWIEPVLSVCRNYSFYSPSGGLELDTVIGAQGWLQGNLSSYAFFFAGLFFGIMCTTMAVVASFMGSVVQVMKEKEDIWFNSRIFPVAISNAMPIILRTNINIYEYQIQLEHTWKCQPKLLSGGESGTSMTDDGFIFSVQRTYIFTFPRVS